MTTNSKEILSLFLFTSTEDAVYITNVYEKESLEEIETKRTRIVNIIKIYLTFIGNIMRNNECYRRY